MVMGPDGRPAPTAFSHPASNSYSASSTTDVFPFHRENSVAGVHPPPPPKNRASPSQASINPPSAAPSIDLRPGAGKRPAKSDAKIKSGAGNGSLLPPTSSSQSPPLFPTPQRRRERHENEQNIRERQGHGHDSQQAHDRYERGEPGFVKIQNGISFIVAETKNWSIVTYQCTLEASTVAILAQGIRMGLAIPRSLFWQSSNLTEVCLFVFIICYQVHAKSWEAS
jgi:hypothetical protein